MESRRHYRGAIVRQYSRCCALGVKWLSCSLLAVVLVYLFLLIRIIYRFYYHFHPTLYRFWYFVSAFRNAFLILRPIHPFDPAYEEM